MKVIKNINFWKRFLKYLTVGLSCMVILYFLQAQPSKIFADYTCPADTGVVTFSSSSQVLPAGTTSTTVSWNPAANASAYFVTVRTAASATLFTDDNYTGTSLIVSGLQNGQSYVVNVRPKNNCGSGNSYQLNFSVATASCSAQQVWCPSTGTYLTLDPNNNCQVNCPGQSNTGALTCTISQGSPVQQGNNSYLYTLTGNSSGAVSSWGWDLTNDDSIDRSDGQTIQQQYFASVTVRLHITNSSGQFGDCYTNITLPTNQGQGGNICTTDVLRCPDGSYVSRNPNNACNFYACQNAGGNNQCRSISCSSLPANCYYTVQPLTYSCDPNAQLTCGQISCNTNNQPVVNPGNNPITFPSFPNPFGGNSQNTWVGVSNINNNENNNLNFSDSFSSSWASGGGGGSSNVTINW